jgi:hypothetical protein
MNIDVLQVSITETEEIWTSIAVYCDCGQMTELDIKTENTIMECPCKRPWLISQLGEDFFGRPYTIREDRILFPQNYQNSR